MLCLALLYGVYTETGKWTTLSLFLIFFASELLAYGIKTIREALEEIFKLMD